jgi:hypothetical protein
MTLAEYDEQVGQHLHAIVAGAEMVKSHISQLVYRPSFETLAFEQIETVEYQLGRALETIRQAKASYQGKPVD